MPKTLQPEQRFEELVGRTEGLRPWRYVLHAAGGLFVAWMVYTLSPASAATRWLFGIAFLVFLLVDLLRLRLEALNRFFFRTVAALLSPREAEGMTGIPAFILGVFLVLWPAGGTLAVPSVLVFSLADPAAGTLGRLFGKRPLGKGTLEGALAFFATAVAVLVPFAGMSMALLVAALVAVMEILPTRLNDNFVIPVATAAFLWVLPGVG